MMRVRFDELLDALTTALRNLGFEDARARLCARLFAETTLDGVYSHGLNRFPRFVAMIRNGNVDIHAAPEPVARHGALERWDGHGGPGNLNAYASMARSIELAKMHGVGCVALANTNHWMRGGSYGWQAVAAGLASICWTNTMPNLPPWGASDPRVGNNPLVIAVPRAKGAVVLDMAMSQFSYGALASYAVRGELLPVDGGFDNEGHLTRDPAAIGASQRPLPIGYWKGSGLAVVLDLLAALLSGGRATHQILNDPERETGLSQVFIAFELAGHKEELERLADGVVASLGGARYPGERTLRIREENLAQGVPVEPAVWEFVMSFSSGPKT
jgi:3-dehydro-L-gulonate 2-dehydrogenase